MAAVGAYGVISFSVSRRTHELGIRMALGAKREDVVRLVLQQALTMVVSGIALGLLGALAATRALGTLL
jgi:putative ABC transport system permease protein